MSDINQEILFPESGMNRDDDERFMRSGDSDYRLNILIGEDGSNGVITNLKGNEVVSYDLGNSNTYFVLGSCYDALTRNVYYFIFSQPYDTTGSDDYEYDNRLLQFNEDDETITLIFRDTKNYFGLDPARPMRDPFVLGNWLFFNPQTSEPKMIDLIMAVNYTRCYWGTEPTYYVYDATETYYYGDKVAYYGGLFLALTSVAVGQTPVTHPAKWERISNVYQNESFLQFDSEFRYAFNVIKQPPAHRPICYYGTDTERSFNNVKGVVFRFTHRYKYHDNTYSKFGAYSDITLPPEDESYNGEVANNDISNNYISVKIPLFSAALIKDIEIVFQVIGGNWRLAKIVGRRDLELITESYYTYNFYNDESYPEIDDTYINISHDSVPQTANAQEIINKNILCYGGCTEGFANLAKEDIDVDLTPEIVEFEVGEGARSYGGLIYDAATDVIYQYQDDPLNADIIQYAYVIIDFQNAYDAGVSVGDVFRITIDDASFFYILTDADDDSVQDLVVALVNYVSSLRPLPVFVDPTDDSSMIIESAYGVTEINIGKAAFYNTGLGVSVHLIKERGFKTGAWHPFCIFYYDESLRRWDAQAAKEKDDGAVAWEINGTTVYVPLLAEYSPTPTGLNCKWNINWEVRHLPPEGAKYWRWGYAGNSLCSYFVRYIIDDDDPIGDVAVGSADEPLNTTYINIKPLQTLKTTDETDWNKFPNSHIDPYSWELGDRIRFVTAAASADDIGTPLDAVYDYEILAQNITDHKIYIKDFDYAKAGVGAQSLVEIYRPLKRNTETVFYELGEIIPIVEDSSGNLVHGSTSPDNNQDYGLGIAATGVFTAGDVYHILRTPSCPIEDIEGYIHESMWYSDFYDSDDWDKGKTGEETLFGQRYLNIVRYSQPYLANTQINGLSTFDGGGYKELNDVYGNIMRIIEIGDTLKVYQRKKPSSILIGRTEYQDAAGNVNVAISERILGAIRYSTTNYGTEFPESISRNNRYVYGFDIYNGVIWRDSANGIFPISGRYESADGGGDYKMETYFKQKSKDLLVSGVDHVQVMTAWDERHKNLYVIFKDAVLEENNDNIIFHEPSNRWICFTEMDRTYEEGWNQILELDWWVLWGFDGGLGYYFDEDTRMAVFDIGSGLGTPETVSGFAPNQTLTMTLLDPSIIVDASPTASLLPLTISLLAPVPISSWMTATDAAITIAYDCDTIGEVAAGGTSTIRATVSSFTDQTVRIVLTLVSQSWLKVTDSFGNEWNVGDTLISGVAIYQEVTLYFFSESENSGGVRTASVRLSDMRGNHQLVNITQEAYPLPIDVRLQVKLTDLYLQLSDGHSGTASAGTAPVTVYASFTPTHVEYPTGYSMTVYYELALTRTGVYSYAFAGSGFWTDVIMGLATNREAYVTEMDVMGGDDIHVYLFTNPPVSSTVYPSRESIVITPIDPLIIVAESTMEDGAMTFVATDVYDPLWTLAQRFKITALPIGASITFNMTDWLRIADGTFTEIYDGGTMIATGVPQFVWVVPRTTNTGGVRYGTVTTVIYGLRETATVQQDAPLTTFLITDFGGDVYRSSSSTASFFFKDLAHETSCDDSSNQLNLILNWFKDSTKADTELYTVYYSIWVKPVGESNYLFYGKGSIQNCLNNVGVDTVLYMQNDVYSGDEVQVWISNTIGVWTIRY